MKFDQLEVVGNFIISRTKIFKNEKFNTFYKLIITLKTHGSFIIDQMLYSNY